MELTLRLQVPILLFYLFFFSQYLAATHNCNFLNNESTLKLVHVNSPCSPFKPKTPLSWHAAVLQMQNNDECRFRHLAAVIPLASGRAVTQNPTYIVSAKIGTPARNLFLAIDTSNDAAWVPCSGCAGCPRTAATYNPSKSSSSKSVPCTAPQCSQVSIRSCVGAQCGFNMTYGGSTISATLLQDNVTLAGESVPSFTFGCAWNAKGSNLPAQGLLGLGRGPLSLLSQTSGLYLSTFSYCLPSYKSPNFSGWLSLGPISQPTIVAQTTPLLKNPRRPSFYYVNLVGIKVGRRSVVIPPIALAFNPNTGAGTIFDSGTVFSMLVKPAYTAVRDEFRRQMGNATVSFLGGFDTCYTVPVKIPTMTFMFPGMNMTLPQDNFLIHSSSGSLSCLAMAAAQESSALNVIATFQQQNQRVFIDVPNSKLGVARVQCS